MIDPEIGDELRVTVVATGLDHSQRKRQPKEKVTETMRVVRNGTTGLPEPGHMDSPEPMTSYSSKDRFRGDSETNDLFSPDENIDYLDIPAFLRNQAD